MDVWQSVGSDGMVSDFIDKIQETKETERQRQSETLGNIFQRVYSVHHHKVSIINNPVTEVTHRPTKMVSKQKIQKSSAS